MIQEFSKIKLYDFSGWSNMKTRSIHFIERGGDEPAFEEVFCKISDGWNVVDVGAAVGYYTVKAGLAVGEHGKVLAIEPHPQVHDVLQMNIELYNLNNVRTVCKAVSNRTGKIKLYEGQLSRGATTTLPLRSFPREVMSQLLRWFRCFQTREVVNTIRKRITYPCYDVCVDTLDAIIRENGLKKVDLIKIDCQGAELEVLEGAVNTLEKDKPTLLVEVHRMIGEKTKTLYRILEKIGYKLTFRAVENRDDIFLIAQPHLGKNG